MKRKMAADMDLSGRTIASVEATDYASGLRIVFTDGMTLDVRADEYAVNTRLLSPRAIAQLERRDEIHEARFARSLARKERAREIKEARITRAKAILPTKAFERWRRRVYPTMNEIITDVWSGPKLREAVQHSPSLLDRFAS